MTLSLAVAAMSLLAAGRDAGAPLVVPAGGSSWNAFQVLGVGPTAVAVREVTAADVDEADGALCENPGMGAVLRGRTGTESLENPPSGTEGVNLHVWPLPAPGASVRPVGVDRVIYRSGLESAGCTSEAAAKTALASFKAFAADAGVALAPSPPHADVFFRVKESEFKGTCFMVGKSPKGCSLTRTVELGGAPVELSLVLEARSDCVTAPGQTPGLGCQIDRRYRGTLSHKGGRAHFDLKVPPRGDNSDVVLQGIALSATPEVTLALVTVSWCYLSCRERVPVLVRVR